MFSVIKGWFTKSPATPVEKRIAFIDGDQDLTSLLKAYHAHVANTGTETHLVRLKDAKAAEPKVLRKLTDVNKIYLSGYTSGKEVVDKFIAGFIQKAVSDGYTHITVVSSDYDFIDIFKMAVQIDPHASEVTFRMVVPHAMGRLAEAPAQIANINITRMGKE